MHRVDLHFHSRVGIQDRELESHYLNDESRADSGPAAAAAAQQVLQGFGEPE